MKKNEITMITGNKLISDGGLFFKAHIMVIIQGPAMHHCLILNCHTKYRKHPYFKLDISKLSLKILITICSVFPSLNPFLHRYSACTIKEKETQGGKR
jgi:hypothetical protein